MQTLTVSVEKKETQEVEITVPCFFRSQDEKDYIGVLDENTVVHIYDSGTYKSLTHSELWIKKHEVTKAWFEYHSCTEAEFLTKYDEVIESISLHPKLAV